mmetsp:Transcript_38027/g.46462  ORF Transcript_38027/g.46462 Transcript_38027/m.46462 type:complete len:415 (-) Transcript_38027:290-1534(-)
MPVSGVDILRVALLLMVVGLVSDVDNLVEQGSAQPRAVLLLGSRLIGSHLVATHDALLNHSLRGILHRLEHLLLFLLSQVLIKISSALVLAFTQLAVLGNDFLALLRAPHFVVELLLLIALVLDQLDDHKLTPLQLQLLHELFLLVDEAASTLLSLLASGLSQRLLRALLQTSRFQGKRASACHDGRAVHRVLVQGASEVAALCSLPEGRTVSRLRIEASLDCALGSLFLDARVNAIGSERVLKLFNAVADLVLSLLQLLLSNIVILLRLLELELEGLALAIALALLVFLPVLHALLVPLLHEAGVALELVDLNASHFLFAHGGHLAVLLLAAGCHTGLPVLLLFKFFKMRLHVELLLRLVERVNASLEELVLHLVVLLLRVGNLLGGLVVAELASLGEHGDVSRRVHLLQHHL